MMRDGLTILRKLIPTVFVIVVSASASWMAVAEEPRSGTEAATNGSLGSLAALAEMQMAQANGPANSTTGGAPGSLRVPDDYRSTYQFLGSWAIAADQGKGSQQIHSVYASPGAVAAYQKTGHFPDGAVLVKEVFDTATDEMTTGTVSRAQTLKGWFVMVRDSRNSHPGNRLWGDGWGWSWFDAPDRAKTTTTDYQADCQSCHIPAQATDWIYVQGYPALKK